MSTQCATCGNAMEAGDRFCRVCGAQANVVAPVPPTVPAVPPETSGMAVASLVCGLFLFAFPLSIIAIILGHMSLSQIRKSAGRLKGDGLAIAGLVLGYAGVAAIPVILIIAAIAIPNLLRARMAANEASAVASLQTILRGEVSYVQSHPEHGFTCSLSDLATDQLIDNRLASGQKNGYAFELSGCSSVPNEVPNTKYWITAYPVSRNQTGVRAFCADESAVIKADAKGSTQDCMQSGTPLQE